MMFGKSVGFGIQQEWMNGMNHTLTLTSEQHDGNIDPGKPAAEVSQT